MEKILFGLALEAFSEWLRELDSILDNGRIAFEEFSGHAQRRELKEAGESLARAEESIRYARAELAEVIVDEPAGEPIAEPHEEWFEESFGKPPADPDLDDDFPSGEFPLD